MWYTAIDVAGTSRILYASSADGIAWAGASLSHDIGTYSLEPDADLTAAKNPSVIKDNGVYHMWYEGVDNIGVSRIIHCSSLDGMTWGDHQIVLSAELFPEIGASGFGTPHVVKDLDMFYMWFIIKYKFTTDIYFARSSGGTVWYDLNFVLSRKQDGPYGNDENMVGAVGTVVNRDVEVPNVMKSAKIKIYND
jgi:predicted GH43/DUF377 family glycosyl hydrolase